MLLPRSGLVPSSSINLLSLLPSRMLEVAREMVLTVGLYLQESLGRKLLRQGPFDVQIRVQAIEGRKVGAETREISVVRYLGGLRGIPFYRQKKRGFSR